MSKTVGLINGWFEERSYGWVSTIDDGTRCFLHTAHVVSGEPAKGKLVRFDSVRNSKGYLCTNVEVFTDRREMERSDAAALLANSTDGAQ